MIDQDAHRAAVATETQFLPEKELRQKLLDATGWYHEILKNELRRREPLK